MTTVVYATVGLVDALLELARERDPTPVTIPLGVTSADELDDSELPAEASVFTHFYLPDVGGSVTAVFGVDLGTPAGQTPGVFVTHPDGRLTISRSDELREVVLVAIPPWDRTSLVAFGRDGRRRPLELVDVDLPQESIP